jgi:hypothetical protein
MPVILGTGEYRYEVVDNWAKLGGEVSYTNWRNRYKDKAPPAGLRSLQKLVKVR